MAKRRLNRSERASASPREDYVIEMLFQLARIAIEDHDSELADGIHEVWKRFSKRAEDRAAIVTRAAG